jgi:hypothetical protein
LIEAYLKDDSEIADNTLASKIGGVGSHLVSRVREELIARGEIKRHKSLRGKDGKLRVAKYSRIIAKARHEIEVAEAAREEPQCEEELHNESRQAAPEPEPQKIVQLNFLGFGTDGDDQ